MLSNWVAEWLRPAFGGGPRYSYDSGAYAEYCARPCGAGSPRFLYPERLYFWLGAEADALEAR